jgi:hypothetical protein
MHAGKPSGAPFLIRNLQIPFQFSPPSRLLLGFHRILHEIVLNQNGTKCSNNFELIGRASNRGIAHHATKRVSGTFRRREYHVV